jgi:hypothetical protein
MTDLKLRIEKRRKSFIFQTSVFTLLFVLSLAALIFYNQDLRVFIVFGLLFVFCAVRLGFLFKNKTVSVRSRLRRGVIVDKKEKVIIIDSKITGSYGSFSEIRPFEHDRNEAIEGTIYIKEENGNVFSIEKLNEAQSEFYAVGDEVVILAGARFPLVTNEPPSRQKWLCPVCGRVSPDGVDCPDCGLPFVQ